MAAYTRSRSSGPLIRSTTTQPSLHSTSFAASRSLQRRPSSPTRVNLYNCASQSLTRVEKPPAAPRKTCTCSPTNHPGSFRCSLHRSTSTAGTASYDGSSDRLNMRRFAMKNSLARIGAVEGDWVKRALAALIRPSSHQHRRRGEFQPRPSRLSVMTKY